MKEAQTLNNTNPLTIELREAGCEKFFSIAKKGYLMFRKDPCFDVEDYEHLYEQYSGTLYKAILNETDDDVVAKHILRLTFNDLFVRMPSVGPSPLRLFTIVQQALFNNMANYR